MARHDPAAGRDFQLQKDEWLAQALEHLPIAIGLIDGQGKFLRLVGSLRHLFGPVVPSRSGEVIKSWKVFDDTGTQLARADCPIERTLTDGCAANGVDAVYMGDTDRERRVRLYAMPFVDATGQSTALMFVHDVALERQAQDQKFGLMQQRFVDALVAKIRHMADGDEHASEAQVSIAQTLGFNAPPRARAPDSLSPREEEVLRLMAWGNSRKQIGAQLGIAVKTVEFHRSSAARKLDLKSRVDVVRYAIERGWMNAIG